MKQERKAVHFGVLRQVLVLCAFVLIGGNPTESMAGPRTLVFMTNPYIRNASESIAAEFMRQNPDVVVDVVMSPRDNDQTLQTLLLNSLTGRSLPDLAVVNGNLVRPMADRGLAQPITLSKNGAAGAADISSIRVNGKVYGLTFGLSMPVVLFNSRLLADIGISDRDLPTDWAGILAIARKISSSHRGIIGGFMEHDSSGAYNFITLVQSFGGKMMSSDETRLEFDSSAGKSALEVLRGFGKVGQAREDMSNRQARQAFDAGAIGVFVTVSSAIPTDAQMVGRNFRVVVRPFPVVPGAGQLPMAGPTLVLLSRDIAQKSSATAFMRYASGERGQALLANQSGYIPSSPDALKLSALQPSVKRQYQSLLNSEIPIAVPWYAFPGFNSVEIGRLIEDNLERVISLELSPEEALENMRSSVRTLLPSQRAKQQ